MNHQHFGEEGLLGSEPGSLTPKASILQLRYNASLYQYLSEGFEGQPSLIVT